MKTFYICSMPCPRRRIDSQKCYDYLIANGYLHTNSYKDADIILISTCAFIESKEDESAGIVNEIYRSNRTATMIIMGCLSKINPSRLKPFDSIVTLSPDELHKLDDILSPGIKYRELPDPNIITDFIFRNHKPKPMDKMDPLALKIHMDKMAQAYAGRGVRNNRPLDRTYHRDSIFNIRISGGCLGNCSYCAIKLAVGKLVSKPITTVLDEFRKGLDEGYKTFTLIADDTGCYGLDIGTNITKLLKALFAHAGNYKLIVKDFNIQWLIRFYSDLKPLFMEHGDKIDYLILPVQSGSDRILKLMRRPYQAEETKELLLDLKRGIQNLRMDTAMMVGFPGESEEDFQETIRFVKEVCFHHVWIYEYHDRPNTFASKMNNKVPKQEIQKRARRLVEVQEEVL